MGNYKFELNKHWPSKVSSAFLGIAACSFVFNFIFANYSASHGSKSPDTSWGLIYMIKGASAVGYVSRQTATEVSLLMATSLLTLILAGASFLSLSCFVPEKLKQSSPDDKWYNCPESKFIFLCSAALFFVCASFFGSSIANCFVTHDWFLSHRELQ